MVPSIIKDPPRLFCMFIYFLLYLHITGARCSTILSQQTRNKTTYVCNFASRPLRLYAKRCFPVCFFADYRDPILLPMILAKNCNARFLCARRARSNVCLFSRTGYQPRHGLRRCDSPAQQLSSLLRAYNLLFGSGVILQYIIFSVCRACCYVPK